MSVTASLARRMAGPQRHRLLQGYPAVPLMRPASDDYFGHRRLDGALDHPKTPEPAFVTLDPGRKLILGIIPHTQCTPKVRGCGFCTFGQDPYRRSSMNEATQLLRLDVDGILKGRRFAGRDVAAMYFGGGTANLTPIGELDSTFSRLARAMNLRNAELTLEGIPSLFVSRFGAALRWLAKLPVRQKRISMGIQTFDPDQLRRMGREHFGDEKLIARVIRDAKQRGIGTSGDFLFNLPHQSRAQMLADVERAVAMGLDQICVYHLVLYEGLGTVWSRDLELIAALPGNDEAVENWLAVREALLGAGYVQTTLTNFERADVHASDRRFMYEELSFSPGEVDGLGIGPLSLSTFVDLQQRRAVKLLRSRDTNLNGEEFGQGDFYFPYEAEDLQLLWLTRTLPRLRWSGAGYRAVFGRGIEAEFGDVVAAIVETGLAVREGEDVALTGRGMFFADAIAGVVAERRVEELREGGKGVHTLDLLHDHGHMG